MFTLILALLFGPVGASACLGSTSDPGSFADGLADDTDVASTAPDSDDDTTSEPNDAGGDGSADVVESDGFPPSDGEPPDSETAEVPDPCEVASCDDGDPCTDDGCDDGVCSHLPVSGCAPPCDPWMCVDGDPCTKDACGPDGECVNEEIPGCACECGTDADCDDGDPCTVTWCDSCECLAAVAPSCGGGSGDCSSEGVVPVSSVLSAAPGVVVKVAGSPTSWTDVLWSTDYDCDPGQCCNTYAHSVALVDGSGALPAEEVGSDPQWECMTNGCVDETDWCKGPHLKPSYWMWGVVASGKPGQVPVAAPAETWLDVQGWCLQTNESGLVGWFVGAFDFYGPELQKADLYVTVDALGVLVAEVQPYGSCPGCSYSVPGQVGLPITTGDGWLTFEMTVDGPSGLGAVTVNLGSTRNMLDGVFGPYVLSGGSPFFATSAGYAGAATFSRLPDAL